MGKKSKNTKSPASSKRSTPGQSTTTPTKSRPQDAPPTPKTRLPMVDSPTPKGGSETVVGDGTEIFAVPKLRPKLRREASDDIGKVMEGVRENSERTFSQLSAVNDHATDFKHPKMEGSESPVAVYVRNVREIKEKQRDAVECVLAILNKEWHGGFFNGVEGLFRAEVRRLEKNLTTLRTDIIVLHTSYHEICGRMVDGFTWQKDRDASDWSYLDQLIRLYKTPEGARCALFAKSDPKAQEQFRADVLKAYDGASPSGNGAYCVISGGFHPAECVQVVHIVTDNVGESTALHIFGPKDSRDGHIMAAENGIPIHGFYKEKFNNGRLIIVPDMERVPGEWKTQWLYEEDITPGEGWGIPSGVELHNRPLKFRENNAFRPASRYLYFAYCMSILHRQRYDVPGWWKEKLQEMPQNMWASPGHYVRTSTLRKLARRVGHLTEGEALEFSGESVANTADDDADEKEDRVPGTALRCKAPGQTNLLSVETATTK